METIKKFKANLVGRDYVVGDIHGCFDKLKQSLIDIGFNELKDRLFSVGDLVDRGTQSHACLEWLNKPFFHSVLGNHEQMAISYFGGEAPQYWYSRNGGDWFIGLDKESQEKYALAFKELPIAIEIDTKDGLVGVVHAECPSRSWKDLEYLLTQDERKDRYKEIAIWSREKITDANTDVIDDIGMVICGHTPVKQALKLGNVLYIDTGAVFGNELTIIGIN